MNNAQRRREILQEISKIDRMERGGVCQTRRIGDPEDKFFFNHTVYERGKSQTRYIRKDEVEELKRHIQQYDRFRQLIAEYEDMIIQETRTERLARRKSKGNAQ